LTARSARRREACGRLDPRAQRLSLRRRARAESDRDSVGRPAPSVSGDRDALMVRARAPVAADTSTVSPLPAEQRLADRRLVGSAAAVGSASRRSCTKLLASRRRP
jgi:hypothetical protein